MLVYVYDYIHLYIYIYIYLYMTPLCHRAGLRRRRARLLHSPRDDLRRGIYRYLYVFIYLNYFPSVLLQGWSTVAARSYTYMYIYVFIFYIDIDIDR